MPRIRPVEYAEATRLAGALVPLGERPLPVNRIYYRLLLEDGRVVTVCYNFATSRWAMQSYQSRGWLL